MKVASDGGMPLEAIPLVLGGLIGLAGLLLLLDAWLPDEIFASERRQHKRRERDRLGETLVGLGVLSMAAAFVSRDAWKYSTLMVIAGSVVLLWGVMRNGGYLREVFARSQRPRA